jgi:ATP-dependent DNA helicase RecG
MLRSKRLYEALARRSSKSFITGGRALLGRLMEAGLILAHWSARNREYSLSAAVYRRLGGAADYVRQAAFDNIQQEQMVMQFVQHHGRIYA